MGAPDPYRPFTSLLVANRGEVASRILRTARALGLRTVAVYAEPDIDAPFVGEADIAVPLAGAAARDTYLVAELVLEAAERSGAEAVHPGYGFLSESAAFAAAVQRNGLVWVGPSPASMEVMAGKVGAKERMASVGVPTLPSAVVAPGDDLAPAFEAVGLPLLVKASAGGGGKGMRLVEAVDELEAAVAVAAREASSSFGDATVFLERYLPAARHVEVQVLGDAHGTVVHLGDRECSVQRRHQKVIEEAPAPTLSPPVRERMAAAAVSGAADLCYVGAGTFEFLVDGDEFFFLEMNTRLQVEHPVTEEVTGLDLVELQLRIAAGHPLPFGQQDVAVRGHAIEARLYAEDPAAGWLPSTGRLHRFAPGTGDGVRWDSGVRTGSVITPHYDPLLAKVIACAPSRDLAAARLARALSSTVVHGVTTNAGLLVRTLRHPHFLAAETTTAFLEDHPDLFDDPGREGATRRHLVVATLLAVDRRCVSAPLSAFAPPGWRNVGEARPRTSYEVDGAVITVEYRIDASGRLLASIDGRDSVGLLLGWDGRLADVEVDGLRYRCTADIHGASTRVQDIDAATTARELPRFRAAEATDAAGGLVAPVPGTVVAVHVATGEQVTAGQVLMVLEAMKVEHQVRAPIDGVVDAVLVESGASVEAHAPLVRLKELS